MIQTAPTDRSTGGGPQDGGAWEKACVQRAQAGDAAAFGELTRHYAGRVYAILYRLVRNREEAEDLAQDAFLRAHRFVNRYDASRPFRNWMFAVATNVGLNALRSRRRRGFPVRLDARDKEGGATVQLVSRGIDGRQSAMRGELKEQLAQAVGKLEPRAALLIQLHYNEGLSVREAATIVGMKEGTAKVAMHRARKKLREWLVEDEMP